MRLQLSKVSQGHPQCYFVLKGHGHIMLDVNEFKRRVELCVQSNSVIEAWDAVIDEIIKSTYPWVNLHQAKLLACVIDVIWTSESSSAWYTEVAYRLRLHEKQLFPSYRHVRETIRELCEKGVMKCKIWTLISYKKDGTLFRKSRLKILIVPDEFRIESINAMAEVLRYKLSGYLLPEKK